MKLKRNYLTAEELIFIVENILNAETEVEKEIVKIGIIAQLLIEDLEERDTCNEYFDIVFENGIDFSREVVNYYMIDKIVEKENSLYSIIKSLIESLEDSIKDLPNEMQKIDFKEISDKINGEGV